MDFQPFSRSATFEMEEGALQPSMFLEQQIKFHLHLKVQTSNWIHTQDSLTPHSSYSSNYNIPSVVTVVPESDSISYDYVRAAVGKAITECRRQGLAESCLLNDEDRRNLTDVAWEAARKINKETLGLGLPPVYNVLALDFKAVVDHRCISFDSDGDVAHRRMQQLPAAEESCSCCICLEEIHGGAAMPMPCSHVFHGDCIRKWLGTSRLCPLCRYEIPAEWI